MKELSRDLISVDQNVMMGKPVIKGTRITVELILEKISKGETVEQILSEHPHINELQVRAALEYATMVFKSDTILNNDETVIVSDENEWENIKESLRLLNDKKSLSALLKAHGLRDAGRIPEGKTVEEMFNYKVLILD